MMLEVILTLRCGVVLSLSTLAIPSDAIGWLLDLIDPKPYHGGTWKSPV